jgi:hypothetical protein
MPPACRAARRLSIQGRRREESGSFLKKRTKKLLLFWASGAGKAAPYERESYAAFLLLKIISYKEFLYGFFMS